jgi:hypothetical protein
MKGGEPPSLELKMWCPQLIAALSISVSENYFSNALGTQMSVASYNFVHDAKTSSDSDISLRSFVYGAVSGTPRSQVPMRK